MTTIRAAVASDAEAMAEVQDAIYRAGLRNAPGDVGLVRERYLEGVGRLSCTVAESGDRVVGFQSLRRAWLGNPYGVPEDWGIIGTHIHPAAGRRGIGRLLFAASLKAAREAGLAHVDAAIGADNHAALAYYRAMGFVPYREVEDTIHHRLDVLGEGAEDAQPGALPTQPSVASLSLMTRRGKWTRARDRAAGPS